MVRLVKFWGGEAPLLRRQKSYTSSMAVVARHPWRKWGMRD